MTVLNKDLAIASIHARLSVHGDNLNEKTKNGLRLASLALMNGESEPKLERFFGQENVVVRFTNPETGKEDEAFAKIQHYLD